MLKSRWGSAAHNFVNACDAMSGSYLPCCLDGKWTSGFKFGT